MSLLEQSSLKDYDYCRIKSMKNVPVHFEAIFWKDCQSKNSGFFKLFLLLPLTCHVIWSLILLLMPDNIIFTFIFKTNFKVIHSKYK